MEAAAATNRTLEAVRRARRRGALQATKEGRKYLLSQQQLDDYIDYCKRVDSVLRPEKV